MRNVHPNFMRPAALSLLVVICQIPLSQESSGTCHVSIGEWWHGVPRVVLTRVGTGGEAEDALLDEEKPNGDIVNFSEEGGYGILPTGRLDAFASKVLNLTPEPPPKRVVALFHADDFENHPLDGLNAVPEAWSPVIGSLILLLLLLRRRA